MTCFYRCDTEKETLLWVLLSSIVNMKFWLLIWPLCNQIYLTPGWRNHNAVIKTLNWILNFGEKNILPPVFFLCFQHDLSLCISVCVQKSSFCQYFVVWPGVDPIPQEGVKSFPCYWEWEFWSSAGSGLHPTSNILKLYNEDIGITGPCLLYKSIGRLSVSSFPSQK